MGCLIITLVILHSEHINFFSRTQVIRKQLNMNGITSIPEFDTVRTGFGVPFPLFLLSLRSVSLNSYFCPERSPEQPTSGDWSLFLNDPSPLLHRLASLEL